MKRSILTLLTVTWLLTAVCASADDDGDRPVLSLEDTIRIALETSPVLGRAAETVTGADYARQKAKADFLPTLSADFTFTALEDDPYMITPGGVNQVAHDTQYRWGVNVVQPLFTAHALSARHEMAGLELAVARKAEEQAALDVTRAVKRAYYRLLLTLKIRMVADETFETLASHEKDAQMFYDRGITRRNDLLRAQVALANAVQLQERARANVSIAVSDLNRLLSRNISEDTSVADIETVECRPYELGTLIETGLNRRPELQAMALVSDSLDQVIRLEKSAYYPEVSAIGSYWQNGDTVLADNNDYENDHNASILLQATWNFFDSGRTRSGVARARAEKRAYAEQIRETEDAVRLEIKTGYLNLGVAEHNIRSARVAFSQAEENLRITQLGYRQEAATSTEVLDARTDLTQAKTNYYQALYGYLDALAALDRAVGGKADSDAGSDTEPIKEVTHEKS